MSTQEELIEAEQAQDVAERAAYDALDADLTPDEAQEAKVEEPVEATTETTEEEKPEEKPNAEFEDAKKRLAFAKVDHEALGFTEEQAIAVAATLKETQTQKDQLLADKAELAKQIETSSSDTDTPVEEQSSELGRPTEQPTPAVTVDVSKLMEPVALSLNLDDEESGQLGELVQAIVEQTTQAQTSEVGQLRAAVLELATRAMQTEYGDRFPDASQADLQQMLGQAQALTQVTGNGSFDENLDLVHAQRFPKAAEPSKPALPKQPKPSSTPSRKKPAGDQPLSKEDKARAVFDAYK